MLKVLKMYFKLPFVENINYFNSKWAQYGTQIILFNGNTPEDAVGPRDTGLPFELKF